MKKNPNSILTFLSAKEKEIFLDELCSVIEKSRSKNDFSAVCSCMDDWEATAEINSIPGFSESIAKKMSALKKTGLIT